MPEFENDAQKTARPRQSRGAGPQEQEQTLLTAWVHANWRASIDYNQSHHLEKLCGLWKLWALETLGENQIRA